MSSTLSGLPDMIVSSFPLHESNLVSRADQGSKVIDWDCSSHGEAYKMWEQAMFADGGEKCRQLTESSGEPLIEGLIVGTEDTRLSVEEAESV